MENTLSCHRPARAAYRVLAAAIAALFFSGIVGAGRAAAATYGGFSFGVGEEFNDNIYFSTQPGKENRNDWITHIVPTFSLLYATPGDPTPVLSANLTPEGQIFARNPDLNNFADNLSFDSAYTYKFSPKLTFNFADYLSRYGVTRTIGLQAMGPPPQLPLTPTDLPSLGSFVPLPLVQGIEQLVTKGRSLNNSFSILPVFQYSPVLTFTGGYAMSYTNGNNSSDFTHSVGVRGVYNWRQEHNFFAGYTVNVFDSGHKTTVIHSFDIGDDFFSNLKIRLSPTWTLSGAFGLAFNTGGSGPAVVTNLNATLVKVWENATLNFAIRRGLTTSLGLFSGPSTTTTFSAGYGIRLTERLTGLVGTDYSLLGEKSEADIEVFRAAAGLQYWINSWLSSNLWYSRRWRSAAARAVDVPAGRAGGNSVIASITAHFDVYPNPGLARGGINRPLFAPIGTPSYERTEMQQPLRPDLGRPELQQPTQQQLREPARPTTPPPPPPPPPESTAPGTDVPPAR
jgi:hypothetical protein